MKRCLFFFLTISLMCVPYVSYAQKALKLSPETEIAGSAVRLLVNSKNLTQIRADLEKVNQATLDTLSRQKQSCNNLLENAMKAVQIRNVLDAIHGAELSCFYQADILLTMLRVKDDEKANVYKGRMVGLRLTRGILAHDLETIQIVYGDIDKVAVLHLADKAKEEIRSSLQHIDSVIAFVEVLTSQGGPPNK